MIRIFLLLLWLPVSSFNKIQNQKSFVMQPSDFTTTLLVDQSPHEAFSAIKNMRAWWSEGIEGSTEKLNDIFHYHYEDVHSCSMKLVEIIPDQKLEWLVLDNYFNFTKDKSEWKGTKIRFDIARKGNKTEIVFTHIGLTPDYECYSACSDGWTNYIRKSLYNLITTGKGQPNPREGRNQYQDSVSRKLNG